MTSKDELFITFMKLEGAVQLYRSGLQVQEYASKRYKDYYSRRTMQQKEMIEVYSDMLKLEGTAEEIAWKDFPVIYELMTYSPYLEYLKGVPKPEKKWRKKEDLPFYI